MASVCCPSPSAGDGVLLGKVLDKTHVAHRQDTCCSQAFACMEM